MMDMSMVLDPWPWWIIHICMCPQCKYPWTLTLMHVSMMRQICFGRTNKPILEVGFAGVCLPWGRTLGHTLSMRAGVGPKVGWKWEWPNCVGKSEMSIFWCLSITNKIKSCRKFNKRAQRWRQEQCVENDKKQPKLEKLKRVLLKIQKWYYLTKVGLMERLMPSSLNYVIDRTQLEPTLNCRKDCIRQREHD